MKIVILRGGGSLRRQRHSPGSAGSTRERGVMAIGNGSGRWVLVNMSPGVAHQLDSARARLAWPAGGLGGPPVARDQLAACLAAGGARGAGRAAGRTRAACRRPALSGLSWPARRAPTRRCSSAACGRWCCG